MKKYRNNENQNLYLSAIETLLKNNNLYYSVFFCIIIKDFNMNNKKWMPQFKVLFLIFHLKID